MAAVLLAKLGLAVSRPLGVDVDQAVILAKIGITGIGEMPVRVGLWFFQALVTMGAVKWLLPRKKAVIPVLALIIAASPWMNQFFLFWNTPRWEDNLGKRLRPNNLSEQVNLTQKEFFVATNKTYMLPAVVRKIVFNKFALAGQIVSERLVSLADFEHWSAPLSAWAITGMSGLPPKGLLPLMYFWEVPLLLYGMYKYGGEIWKRWKWWIVTAGMLAIWWEKRFLITTGVLFLPVMWDVWRMILERAGKKLLVGWVVLCLVGVAYFYKQIWFETDDWRYSDAKLYAGMYAWVKDNSANFDKFVVTDKLGPTDLMFRFYGPRTKQVEFRQLRNGEEAVPGVAYLGLPGEIEKMRSTRILEKISAKDELVYKYGQGIWIATK